MPETQIVCDICGSSESRQLYDRGRNRGPTLNHVCQHCGFVYLVSRDSVRSMKAKYTNGHFTLEARGSTFPSQEKIKQTERMAWNRFRLLAKMIDLNSILPGKVLEIGCSIGSFLRYVKGVGFDVQGVEPHRDYAEMGSKHYLVPISPNFYEDIMWDEHYFDMVVSFHVLEHALSPKKFLKKIFRELRPGGILFLEVPCIEYPYGGNLDSFFWDAHFQTFSKRTLVGLLEQVGFRLVCSGYAHDFLWVMAENSGVSPSSAPIYPLDNPVKVYTQTHNLHKAFLLKQLILSNTHPLSRVAASALEYTRKLMDEFTREPQAFFPKIGKRLSSWTSVLMDSAGRKLLNNIPGRSSLAHIGVHGLGNAGDVMLLAAVRKVYDDLTGLHNWYFQHVNSVISADQVHSFNKNMKGIVFGGGGLFLPDTNNNCNSGGVWNCSIENLKNIQIPMMVFAVGFNRFNGQEDFAPIFLDHLRELVRRSAFFGVRERSAIRELARYVDDELVSKMVFQPCPTSVLNYLFPNKDFSLYSQQKQLALNIAFDRRDLRFKEREDQILSAVGRTMKWASQQGWEITLAIHVSTDNQIIPWLIRYGVPFREVDLTIRSPRQILDFYKNVNLTIGMRSHSQMIPFGLGKPILSLISHNKIQYFLEDINHPEWGVSILHRDLDDRLISKIQTVDFEWEKLIYQIRQAQQVLWEITLENMRKIQTVIDVKG